MMRPVNEATGESLRERWRTDGWLHLAGFFSAPEIERVNGLVDELWRAKPRRITVDDVDAGQRARMSALRDDQRVHRIKINDLYLDHPAVRDLLLDPRLVSLVRDLLGDAPVLCNSLNLERGSAQEYHADSLYMTPRTEGRLVAAWIALEDVQPGSGPLRLYPGSHLLPPFVFSNGTRHAVTGELPRWAEHMQRELDARGMQPHVIYAQRGDLVIWHSDLLHGAEAIADPALTRRSLVAHYFGREDCLRNGYRLAGEDRQWLKRLPQPADFGGRVLAAIERRWQRLRARVVR